MATNIIKRLFRLFSKILKWKFILWFCILSIPIIIFFGIMNSHPAYDALVYIYMGDGFAEYGEFLHPSFILHEPGFLPIKYGIDSTQLEYSHHFPPLYPAYLGVFYSLFGFSLTITKVAVYILYIILLFVVYFTTKDLFRSREKSLIVTALVGLNPWLIFYSSRLYSEAMVLILFTLVIWAIIKGTKDERYLLLAGLFAGLGYLTKSSVGYFFILAGLCGFIWRFYYMRWEVFKNKYYMGAIAIFLSFVAAWAFRNILRFGWPNWETSTFISYTTNYSLGHLDLFLPIFFIKIIFLMFLLLIYGIFLIPELIPSVKNWRDEENSGLWLAVFTVFLLGSIFAAAFYLVEGIPLLWDDNIRYVLLAYVPLLWLGMKYSSLNSSDTSKSNSNANINTSTEISEPEVSANKPYKKLNRKSILKIIFIGICVGGILLFYFIDVEEVSLLFALGLLANLIRRTPRRVLALFLIGLFIISANTGSIKLANYEKLENDLGANLKDGDTVAYTEELWPQTLYLLPIVYKINMVPYNKTTNATFIIADKDENLTDANYTLIGTYTDVEYYYGYLRMSIINMLRNMVGIYTPITEAGYKLYQRTT